MLNNDHAEGPDLNGLEQKYPYYSAVKITDKKYTELCNLLAQKTGNMPTENEFLVIGWADKNGDHIINIKDYIAGATTYTLANMENRLGVIVVHNLVNIVLLRNHIEKVLTDK